MKEAFLVFGSLDEKLCLLDKFDDNKGFKKSLSVLKIVALGDDKLNCRDEAKSGHGCSVHTHTGIVPLSARCLASLVYIRMCSKRFSSHPPKTEFGNDSHHFELLRL